MFCIYCCTCPLYQITLNMQGQKGSSLSSAIQCWRPLLFCLSSSFTFLPKYTHPLLPHHTHHTTFFGHTDPLRTVLISVSPRTFLKEVSEKIFFCSSEVVTTPHRERLHAEHSQERANRPQTLEKSVMIPVDPLNQLLLRLLCYIKQ